VAAPYVLQAGETETWTGRPAARRLFGAADVFLIPLGIFFSVFSIVWVTLGGWSDNPFSAALLIAFSFYLLIGRFPVKYLTKRASTYKLTSDRALVLRRGKIVAEQDFALGSAQLIESLSRKYATVTFDADPVEGVLQMSIIGKYNWLYENSGMDIFLTIVRRLIGGWGPLRFFDLPLEEAKLLTAAAHSL